VYLYVELLDEDKSTDAGFPLWLIIVLILASLSVIVVSFFVILMRLTAVAAAAVKGSAFVRMESGNGSRNLPSPKRRVWTSSHLQHSLPPAPYTAINVPMVSLVDGRQN